MTVEELNAILNEHKKWLNDGSGQRANLRYADLRYANLRDADLCGANLYGANLYGADLRGAKNVPHIALACPSDGEFVGWKKVNAYLIKLLIPENAKRCSATSSKCRCEYAKVLDIVAIDNAEEHLMEITNTSYLPNITYKVGEIVYPDSFNDDRWNECSHGIHFFVDKQSAIEY